MIPYYKELESGFYLPILDNKNQNDVINVSDDFYNKYSELFIFIDNLKILLNNIDINKLKTTINTLILLKQKIEKFYNMAVMKNLNILQLEKYILISGEIFDILYNLNLYDIEKQQYLNIMKIFNDALLDLGYQKNKIVDMKLPDTWFITSTGNLCNTRSSKHMNADLSEYYSYLKNKFINNELQFVNNKNDKFDPLPEYTSYRKIYEDGYVRFIILDIELHYIDYVKFNGKIFDERYLKIIAGICEMKEIFYNLFKKLNIYTNDPINELNKIIELTKDNYDDILIRCCGVTKVIQETKIIVTSDFDYEYKFNNYIINGWKIRFIPPININVEKGIVEEYSEDFLKVLQFRKQY